MKKVWIDGMKAALEALSGLDAPTKSRILTEIAKKDQNLAEQLKKRLVTMEDLKYLTPSMLRNFLSEIKLDELGLALRICSDELKQFFLGQVSRSMKAQLLDIFNGPKRKKSEVLSAQENIMKVVRKKIEKGEIILKSDQDQWV